MFPKQIQTVIPLMGYVFDTIGHVVVISFLSNTKTTPEHITQIRQALDVLLCIVVIARLNLAEAFLSQQLRS